MSEEDELIERQRLLKQYAKKNGEVASKIQRQREVLERVKEERKQPTPVALD